MQKELRAASELAVSAGQILLQHYNQPAAQVEWKNPGDPVTAADRLASEFLVRELRSRFPDDGIISEEETGDAVGAAKSRVWIVDPMDGTREFIERRGEFAVMIGLAVEGRPAVGAVCQPVSGKLYFAANGLGAFLTERETTVPLKVSQESNLERAIIACSRSHNSPEVEAACVRLGITESIQSGSIGLKLGLICEGRAHLYLDTSGRTFQWDTCGPAAILREAGGRMTDLRGEDLLYNCAALRHTEGLIASNGILHRQVVTVLNAPRNIT